MLENVIFLQINGIPINAILDDIQQYILLEACSPNAVILNILNNRRSKIVSFNIPNISDINKMKTTFEIAMYKASIPYFISSSCILSYLFKSLIRFIELFTTKFLTIFPITNYIIQ